MVRPHHEAIVVALPALAGALTWLGAWLGRKR
jgi:hypothetical protein